MTRVAFLGADAGGTRTTVALVTPDGTELARSEGPSGAVRPGAAGRAAGAIVETARRAAAAANLTLPVAGAVVAAAGAGRALERDELTAALEEAGVARRVRVMGDVQLALHAAFGGGSGIVVAAGTGSAAFARTPDGALRRAGGYGWQLGDEGGGYWLGRRLLALAALELDGVTEPSGLVPRILQALDLDTFDDLVRWAATAAPAQVAALAPVLLTAAGEGEAPPAVAAVREGAAALAALVRVLGKEFPDTTPVPVAMTGTLLTAGTPLHIALREALRASLPRAQPQDMVVDCALSAARLAAVESG